MVAIASFGLMSMTSCDVEDNPGNGQTEGTTCQVTNNSTLKESTIGADGTMYDAKVIFYSADAEISETAINTIAHSGGVMPEAIVAPEGATRARVAFLLMPSTSTDEANVIQYTVDYYALSAETLTAISITGETMLTFTKGATKGVTMTFSEALAQL